MSNREYMIISYKTDPEAVRRWVPELLQPDDNIHLSWVKTESSGAHAPHTIVSRSVNVRPTRPLSVSCVACVASCGAVHRLRRVSENDCVGGLQVRRRGLHLPTHGHRQLVPLTSTSHIHPLGLDRVCVCGGVCARVRWCVCDGARAVVRVRVTSSSAITAGREVHGQPQKFGFPSLVLFYSSAAVLRPPRVFNSYVAGSDLKNSDGRQGHALR